MSRMVLYLASNSLQSTMTFGPAHRREIEGYILFGCFGGSQNAIQEFQYLDNDLTLEQCADSCYTYGYAYFAVTHKQVLLN